MLVWIKARKEIRPCSHCHFYPTRPVARVHTASGSSGTLRPHREVFSVDANDTHRVGAAV